ncbi:pyridoxine 5'-phosphate synthase [candidate division KSB1 bacterium]
MRLGVNIDHIATIREARKGKEPDPVLAAYSAEMAGADGVVCHLREDRRHIQDRDLKLLKETVQTHLNLEMAATDEMINIAINILPDMVTLVPEKREEVTTEGGLNIISNLDYLKNVTESLQEHGIVVSFFIDPDLEQVKASSRAGADYIELHTGSYANAKSIEEMEEEIEKIKMQAMAANKLGLYVSAGHGLNYHNVKEIAKINIIEELNIGHAIVSRAVYTGIEKAVRDMVDLIK